MLTGKVAVEAREANPAPVPDFSKVNGCKIPSKGPWLALSSLAGAKYATRNDTTDSLRSRHHSLGQVDDDPTK
jgi:hypothetical protein